MHRKHIFCVSLLFFSFFSAAVLCTFSSHYYLPYISSSSSLVLTFKYFSIMQVFIILLVFIVLHYTYRVGSYRTNKGILYLSKSSKCIAISRSYLREYNRASIINTRSQRGVSYYSNLKMVNNADVDSDNDTTEEDEIEDDSDAQTEAESASSGDDNINIADIQNMINEMENSTNSTVIEEDSEENRRSAAIKEYELKLQKEITDLENILRAERLNLGRIKDRISESGKSGFFMVQAQVNDFQV